MKNISIGRGIVAPVLIALSLAAGVVVVPSNVRASDLFADYSYDQNLFADYSYNQNLFADYSYDQNLFADYSYDQNLFADYSYDQNLFADYSYDQNLFADYSYDQNLFADYSYDQNLFADYQYDQNLFADYSYDHDLFADYSYDQDLFADYSYDQDLFADYSYDHDLFADYSYDQDLFADYNYDHDLLVTEYYDHDLLVTEYYDHEIGTMVTEYYDQDTGTLVTEYYDSTCQCERTVPSTTPVAQQQQVYNQQCQCYQPAPSYAQGYAQQSFAQAYMPAHAQQYMPMMSHPMIAPQYPSYPNYPQQPHFPQYPQQPQRPQPQQPSNFTSNYCTGGSCNTSIVDNSINGSFNDYSVNGSFNTTAPVYPVTPQPIVSYQIPTHQQGAYCVITASPTSISNGQAAILTWSSNGSTAWLSDGIGAVASNGSLAVRPNTTRTYVLTVSGIYGSNTCSVTINVAGTAPYVSLSQIPYTGFDLGVIGNTIYWMGLAGLAAALAYLVLYFKGGAVAFAGSMISRPAHVAHTIHAEEDHAPAHEEHVTPTHTELETKDTMTIMRSADGTPRIVINRA